MATFKKKDINELVGGDIFSHGGDSHFNYIEIQTGPLQKTHDDDSDYQKGRPTTTDKVFSRYRQNIPWFAVYSYGGTRSSGGLKTFESKVFTKNEMQKMIDEDLVKKSQTQDIQNKLSNQKFNKIYNNLEDLDLSDNEIEKLKNLIDKKKK